MICKIIYEKIHEKKEKKRIKALIKAEMQSNLLSIKKLREDIETIENSPIKENLEPFGLEEMADITNKACKREILNRCIEKLPVLGPKKMKNVLEFYNSFANSSESARDLMRLGGNISAYSHRALVSHLISKLEENLNTFRN